MTHLPLQEYNSHLSNYSNTFILQVQDLSIFVKQAILLSIPLQTHSMKRTNLSTKVCGSNFNPGISLRTIFTTEIVTQNYFISLL